MTATETMLPRDDAELDALLRQGLDEGRWPFAMLPGEMPASHVRRICARTDIILAARERIESGRKLRREALRRALIDEVLPSPLFAQA